jgi:protein TonB
MRLWCSPGKVYPEDARRSGAQGNVAVRLTVDRLGHVLTMELVCGADSALLDEAALAMLKGAILPPFPAEMTQDSLTIIVQVHYSLTN